MITPSAPPGGTGWTATVTGAADVLTDADEAALPHCPQGRGGAPGRRTFAGWTHDPHDTLPRPRQRNVTGFRLMCEKA